MDVKKISGGTENTAFQLNTEPINTETSYVISPSFEQKISSAPENVKNAAYRILGISQNIGGNVDIEEFRKIMEEVNNSLKDIGLYLSFDKIGDLPVVKVKDVSGKVIKIFPPEEVGKILKRISTFFEVLVELMISKRV